MANAWGAAFGKAWGASWGTGSASPTPTPDQASNWQTWKHPQSRRLTKEEEKQERIRLGILPPEAKEAIADAVAAQEKIDAGLNEQADIAAAIEAQQRARDEYLQIMREAYREAFLEVAHEELVKQFHEQVRLLTIKRRAVFLLLLS